MAAHEHEILISFVVVTDVDKRAAQDWLLDRLRHANDMLDAGGLIDGWRGPIGDDTETHVDSYWVAEDDRTDAVAQKGLRSAVYVPDDMTQEVASNVLEQAGILAALGGDPEQVLADAD